MFGCQENQKEHLHLFHKETHENPNDPNPITPAKVQNSIITLLLNPNPVSLPKKKKNPNPVIPLKWLTHQPPPKDFHQRNRDMREEEGKIWLGKGKENRKSERIKWELEEKEKKQEIERRPSVWRWGVDCDCVRIRRKNKEKIKQIKLLGLKQKVLHAVCLQGPNWLFLRSLGCVWHYPKPQGRLV